MDQLPKIVRDRLRVSPQPVVHPDANMLAAFGENSLRESERAQILEHLANCVDCREIVAVSLPELSRESIAAVAMAGAPRPVQSVSRWFQPRMVLRWGGVAACVIVGAFMFLSKETHWSAQRDSRIANLPETRNSQEQYKRNKTSDGSEAGELAQLKPYAKFESREMRHVSPERQRTTGNSIARKDVEAGTAGGVVGDGLADSLSRSSKSSVTLVSPIPLAPPPVPAAPPEEASDQDLDRFKKQTGNEAAADKPLSVPAASEVVRVESAPPPAETPPASQAEAKVEKAKNPKSDAEAAAGIQAATADTVTAQIGHLSSLKDGKQVMRSGARFPLPQWKLSPQGVLLRSLDLGQAWQPVTVAPGVVLRALSVSGNQVWTGGAGGKIYHSSDGGDHWQLVKPAADGQPLSNDITGLEFSDAQHGTLTTANNETWVTADGGLSWQKK